MQNVLSTLHLNIEAILKRLLVSHLKRYVFLQEQLLRLDVSSDRRYQATFNGFYKMQRRPKEWYQYYFTLLEREKKNQAITFKQIFEEIFKTTQRIEPSFSSKLVATIRSEKPIYDRYVRVNLSLNIPSPSRPAAFRLEKFVEVYSILESKMQSFVVRPEFVKLRQKFDEKFSFCSRLSDMKKLDFLLWQFRGLKVIIPVK